MPAGGPLSPLGDEATFVLPAPATSGAAAGALPAALGVLLARVVEADAVIRLTDEENDEKIGVLAISGMIRSFPAGSHLADDCQSCSKLRARNG